MLDTNTISMVARPNSPSALDRRLVQARGASLCLSVVTEAEILFGLAKAPDAKRVATVMRPLLARFTILPWTSSTANTYGFLRAAMHRSGVALGALDMMIAAHALEVGATLVTSDAAFRNVPGLAIENWAL